MNIFTLQWLCIYLSCILEINISIFLMSPFEEEDIYCFANVSRMVSRSVDLMVSADYPQNHLPQRLHISHVDWSRLVNNPYCFLGQYVKDTVTLNVKNGYSSFSWKLFIIKFSYFTRLVITSRSPLIILWLVGQNNFCSFSWKLLIIPNNMSQGPWKVEGSICVVEHFLFQ